MQLGTFDPEAFVSGSMLDQAVVMEMEQLLCSSVARGHEQSPRVMSEAERMGLYLVLCCHRPALCAGIM